MARKTFCWNCWRDWHDEFLSLSPWEQEQFLDKHPRINPSDYEKGRCPFCGSRYDDNDIDYWWNELFGDEESLEYENDYGKADWEEDSS